MTDNLKAIKPPPVFKETPTKIDGKDYYYNNLGVPSINHLWWYHHKKKFSNKGGVEKIGRTFSVKDQKKHAQDLREMLRKVEENADNNDLSGYTPKITKLRKLKLYNQLIKEFGLTASKDVIEIQKEVEKKMLHFHNAVKEEDKNITKRDLYRASTNAWPMFTLQYLDGQTMFVNKTLLGFCLLYPYVDDIYDSPVFTTEYKLNFGARFGRKIRGSKKVKPKTEDEKKMWKMIDYINSEIDIKQYPHPYKCMNGLNNAQIGSMSQMVSLEREKKGDFDEELIWNLTIWKGAGSILSDAALVFKHLPPDLASFGAQYGAITQWLNDSKSIDEDYNERQLTPYVIEYFIKKRKLDNLQERVFNYMDSVFANEDHINIFAATPTKVKFLQMMRAFLMLKMIEGVALNADKFSDEYLKRVERRAPVELVVLADMRRKYDHNICT